MSRFSVLHEYWQVGVGLAIACAFALLSRDELYKEFARGPVAAIMVTLALCFGGLIAFITKPAIYMGIIVVLQATDCIGTAVVNKNVLIAYQNLSNGSNKGSGLKIPPAIYDYYLVRPHFVQRTARLLGYFLAFVLALVGRYQAEAILTQSAWAIVVATTIACEFVIHRWRKDRREKLGPVKGLSAGAGHSGSL